MNTNSLPKNIVLIGMPAVGKSTIGVLLAERIGFAYLDTDIYLQVNEGRKLYDIIAAEGVDGFCDIEEKNIPEPLKIVIFRILQEAMNNVAKYGKANLIRISLAEKENAVEIVIEDNGQGFDVQQTRNQKGPQGGFGLRSMKERAELAGGTLSVKSNPGAGTTIRASWSLEQ